MLAHTNTDRGHAEDLFTSLTGVVVPERSRGTPVSPHSVASTSRPSPAVIDSTIVQHQPPPPLLLSLQQLVERDHLKEQRRESWRPENRAALVPRGEATDSTLSGQLLYAATHVDRTQRRNIANLVAKERLYRTAFCGRDRVPPEENRELAASLTNGSLAFIKYRDESRELSLETLCQHIEDLIDRGYSLTYIFAYLSYLRRKYRGKYPRFGYQTSAFYRTLIDNYERKVAVQPRIGTDEVYTCADRIYETMYRLADEYFWSNRILDELATDRMLFTYIFIFMYITGKRLSELALIGRPQLRTLLDFKALVIRIPKSKKLGRIVMRGYSEDMANAFTRFLRRAIFLFDKVRDRRKPSIDGVVDTTTVPTYHDIPFDQFGKRRLLDANFAQLYRRAVHRLTPATTVAKPRGLSLHSLRRYRAATMFAEGKEIDHIRECLDHSSVRVTNTYINKHLMRSYRSRGGGTNLMNELEQTEDTMDGKSTPK